MPHDTHGLRLIAREMFDEALRAANAGQAVRRAVKLEDERLTIVGRGFDLRKLAGVFAVAVGKAARPMAAALNEILGARLRRGVMSAPVIDKNLLARWQQFAGGHPVPNADSLLAGQAATALLTHAAKLSANGKQALVVFLISGGGSAMMESLRADDVSLADLQAANKLLVHCGATIAEINAVRRSWSRIKGGGLSRFAGDSLQISLIVSDTNAGDEASVASGLTFPSANSFDVQDIIRRYKLAAQFPQSLLHALARSAREPSLAQPDTGAHSHYTLLDNDAALKVAACVAEARGFVVQTARDLVESPIAEGCAQSVSRLLLMQRSYAGDEDRRSGVCLISGGEFSCPVRGHGVGGRNTEAALRSVLDFEREIQSNQAKDAPPNFVALFAGTDGIDGNSPAAGAISDDTTLARARALGMNAHDYPAQSDAYTFFARLGDAITTGATETNVRDVRIMLAR
ncbi:MAG: glycerate kinase type-2 family protein [Pyrinomonadaceae bacterium]